MFHIWASLWIDGSPNANFCILNSAALCSMGKLRVRVEIQNLICLLVFNLGIKRDKWAHIAPFYNWKLKNMCNDINEIINIDGQTVD